MLCSVALLAVTLTLASPVSSGGVYDNYGPQHGPRWSNSHHHESGIVAGYDCVRPGPGVDPTYVPGEDAWGRPVIPAGPRSKFRAGLPPGTSFDILLKKKTLAGRDLGVVAGPFTFDADSRPLALDGLPLPKDCLPDVK